MSIEKNQIQSPNKSFKFGSEKEPATGSPTFGGAATGFGGNQMNTVCGTFGNQNNNMAIFGPQQNSFGNNFFNNTGFIQPSTFGFGFRTPQQTTNICFTGFGEPKTNYCFTTPTSNNAIKKITLVFEHPEFNFGSNQFKKPDSVFEIEVHSVNNQSICTEFSFSVVHVQKFNSLFSIKTSCPLKFLVKAKSPLPSSPNFYNQKITFAFQTVEMRFGAINKQCETIVEIPMPVSKTFSESFVFSIVAAPNNVFEVQTSRKSAFKITFAEAARNMFNMFGNNQQASTGSIYFDQGRQMNYFPSSGGSFFGSQTFGNTSNSNNPNQTPNNSLFGTTSTNQVFGSTSGTSPIQLFGNSKTNNKSAVDQDVQINALPSANCLVFGDQAFGSTANTNNQSQFMNFNQTTHSSCFGTSPTQQGFGFTSENNSIQLFESPKTTTANALEHGRQINASTSATYPVFGGQAFGSTANTNNEPQSKNCNQTTNGSTSKTTTASSSECTDKIHHVKQDITLLHYQPTYEIDLHSHVQTKTNCITAMSEYANVSLDELRLKTYTANSFNPKNSNISKEGPKTCNKNSQTLPINNEQYSSMDAGTNEKPATPTFPATCMKRDHSTEQKPIVQNPLFGNSVISPKTISNSLQTNSNCKKNTSKDFREKKDNCSQRLTKAIIDHLTSSGYKFDPTIPKSFGFSCSTGNTFDNSALTKDITKTPNDKTTTTYPSPILSATVFPTKSTSGQNSFCKTKSVPIFSTKESGTDCINALNNLPLFSSGEMSTFSSFKSASNTPAKDTSPKGKSESTENSDTEGRKTGESSTKDSSLTQSDNSSQKKSEKTNTTTSEDKSEGESCEEDISPEKKIKASSAHTFKMNKIHDILVEMQNRRDSLDKDSTDSDMSNYSFISNPTPSKFGKGQHSSFIQNENHPTGIAIKSYGYYTLPMLDDLKSSITKDGACVVSKFTIGRKGYGSICFNKEVNVAGLHINDIVHFRNKEIIIYPNDQVKEQVMDVLKNTDALVTLEQIWPYKTKPIKDPQYLEEIKYEDKLRMICEKNNVRFVEYRPETGSWLFNIKKIERKSVSCWDIEDENLS